MNHLVVVIAVTALAVGCSSNGGPSDTNGPPVAAPTGSSKAGSPPSQTAQPCPTPTADVPEALRQKSARHSKQNGGSSSITFQGPSLQREVTLGVYVKDPLETPMGDGYSGQLSETTVQGYAATRVDMPADTLLFVWKAAGRCPFRSVTAVGLTDAEVKRILDSVRVEQPSAGVSQALAAPDNRALRHQAWTVVARSLVGNSLRGDVDAG